jgi:uroporphyrinogen decarboxylase
MRAFPPFTQVHSLNVEGLIRNLRRQGTPDRVYFMELFQDRGLEDAIDARYGVTHDLDRADPRYELKRSIAMQRFLGYEYCRVGLLSLPHGDALDADDTADQIQGKGKRGWLNEHKGLITSWEDFEKYPWPDGRTWNTADLEWLCANLPDDMCLLGFGGHFCEYLCWLMGYETLCYALAEQRDLVEALARRILELEEAHARLLMQFDRVRLFWGSDDMGFKTGLMISPDDMRALVLSGHKRLAAIAHEAGRPYLLHACGKRADILEDLIEDVKLDAIHSWEDTIERITDAKAAYGKRLSLLGGIDVDFLCRADEAAIRKRVRDTVRVCQPGGGFCLGTGNTAANYIPADHYLIMLDEGRRL